VNLQTRACARAILIKLIRLLFGSIIVRLGVQNPTVALRACALHDGCSYSTSVCDQHLSRSEPKSTFEKRLNERPPEMICRGLPRVVVSGRNNSTVKPATTRMCRGAMRPQLMDPSLFHNPPDGRNVFVVENVTPRCESDPTLTLYYDAHARIAERDEPRLGRNDKYSSPVPPSTNVKLHPLLL